MRQLMLIFVLSFFGLTAQAYMDESPQMDMQGGAWACGMTFKGTSKGLQVVVGKFTTRAYGTLKCLGINGKKFVKRIRLDISSYKVGPTVGIGYFKIKGISSEISLFNAHPEQILGRYTTTHYVAAVGAGAGYFTATKLGLPQLAYNVSVHLTGGIGVKVGIERLRITALD